MSTVPIKYLISGKSSFPGRLGNKICDSEHFSELRVKRSAKDTKWNFHFMQRNIRELKTALFVSHLKLFFIVLANVNVYIVVYFKMFKLVCFISCLPMRRTHTDLIPLIHFNDNI